MPSLYAISMTPAAAVFGEREDGFFAGYLSATGEVVREGQVWWAAWRHKGEARFSHVYILRRSVEQGGDRHDAIADILWLVNSDSISSFKMEEESGSFHFDLKEEPNVWTVADGWPDSISASVLDTLAPFTSACSTPLPPLARAALLRIPQPLFDRTVVSHTRLSASRSAQRVMPTSSGARSLSALEEVS